MTLVFFEMVSYWFIAVATDLGDRMKTFKITRTLIAAAVGAIASATLGTYAYADEFQLGWADITPCGRWVASGKNIFGSGVKDTWETAEQRVYVSLTYNNPTQSDVQNTVEACAVGAAGAAGIAALASDLTAAAPAFWASFNGCLESSAAQITDAQLKVSDGQCVGW